MISYFVLTEREYSVNYTYGDVSLHITDHAAQCLYERIGAIGANERRSYSLMNDNIKPRSCCTANAGSRSKNRISRPYSNTGTIELVLLGHQRDQREDKMIKPHFQNSGTSQSDPSLQHPAASTSTSPGRRNPSTSQIGQTHNTLFALLSPTNTPYT